MVKILLIRETVVLVHGQRELRLNSRESDESARHVDRVCLRWARCVFGEVSLIGMQTWQTGQVFLIAFGESCHPADVGEWATYR